MLPKIYAEPFDGEITNVGLKLLEVEVNRLEAQIIRYKEMQKQAQDTCDCEFYYSGQIKFFTKHGVDEHQYTCKHCRKTMKGGPAWLMANQNT